MTLRVRRILSLIFILCFLMIAPAIILYATGYKLKSGGFAIERTGMFIIESKPENAKIYLNGKAQKTLLSSLFNKNSLITTPAKIKDLLPGEYNLTLELEGYSSWHKKLTVSPGASTFVKDIYLFKKSLPTKISPAIVQTIDFSPDKTQALIISPGQLALFDLAEETIMAALPASLKGENIAWSLDGQKIVIDNYLYNTDDLKSKIDLTKLTPGISDYKWSSNTLFYRDKTSIYRLDQENLPKKIIGGITFDNYLVKDGFLYLINPAKQTVSLKVIDLTTNKQIEDISLPAANYSFINPEHALLNLFDNDHRILYLVNPLTAYYPVVEIINNIKSTFWSDENNLLYANDFEIWQYNLETRKKTLITRISDTINNAVIHPNKSYIIYSTNRTISAIELAERGKGNIIELARADMIHAFILNTRGKILYFSGRIGNSEELYQLSIQ